MNNIASARKRAVFSAQAFLQVVPGLGPTRMGRHEYDTVIRIGLLILVAASAITLAIWLGVGVLNAPTWQWVHPVIGGETHPSSTWMALASALLKGVLYPPLFEDGFYGGTRFAPLQIAFLAGATRVTGNIVMASNLAAVAISALLLLTVVAMLRRIGVGWPLAITGAALVVASQTGMYMLVFRGDTLPVALQFAALMTVERATPRRAALGGVLCALALVAKVSAIWGIATVAIWLLCRRRWGAAMIAVIAAGLAALSLFSLFEWWSDGRMSINLLGLTFSRLQRQLALEKTGQLFTVINSQGVNWLWMLIPFAFLEIWRSNKLRRDDLLFGCQLALLFAAPVLVLALADEGAYRNHFVDVLVILTTLGIAGIQRLLSDASLARGTMLTAIPLIALSLGIWNYLIPLGAMALSNEIQNVAPSGLPKGYSEFMRNHPHVLSDNPAVPLLSGHRPVVLDAYMLRKIAIPEFDVRQNLVDEIDACIFDAVVLVGPAHEYRKQWWGVLHFSREIYEAIIAHYDFVQQTSWGALHLRSERCEHSSL